MKAKAAVSVPKLTELAGTSVKLGAGMRMLSDVADMLNIDVVVTFSPKKRVTTVHWPVDSPPKKKKSKAKR